MAYRRGDRLTQWGETTESRPGRYSRRRTPARLRSRADRVVRFSTETTTGPKTQPLVFTHRCRAGLSGSRGWCRVYPVHRLSQPYRINPSCVA